MRAEIEKVRGLQNIFLIQPNERIARLAPALRGFVDRDFHFNKYQRQELLNKLAKILKDKQKGLHLSEIEDTLRHNSIHIPDLVTPYMVMSLAQVEAKDRFRLRRGQYLVWLLNAKRLSSKEAFDTALVTLQLPTTFEEIRSVISHFAEREMFIQWKFPAYWLNPT